jgi:tetratricopeptide (TPR) repeat protein
MRRFLSVAPLLLGAAACVAADAPSLKDARLRWLKGNYDEAAAQFEQLAKDEKSRVEATVGLSRCWQSQGDYDKALDVVDAALKAAPKEPLLLARRADVLYERGRWDDAEKAADAAVEASKPAEYPHYLGRWVRARVYRDRGDLKKADAEFRWFVKQYTERSNANDDIKDSETLLLIGQAGSENARWHNLSNQFKFILNDVYADALKYDKAQWQAEALSGALLLEKYNRPEAEKSFDKVLELNPRAAEALVGKGLLAVDKYEFKQAEDFAERALKINPRWPEALRLRADVHLAAGELDAALHDLDLALAVNPRDERTLARRAACLFVGGRKDDADAVAKEVEKFNPKPAVFFFEFAQRLDERRRYDDAEKYLKKAAELQPMLPGPSPALGMLYMRLGREDEASVLLDKGFEADKFNVRVANTRRVLKHLKEYDVLKTEHFLLRYDPKSDAALARYMADYLEEIYADLSTKFQHKMAAPILIEIFNDHDMFSARVTGLPELFTVGACTGRMIALDSPTQKGGRRPPFNWARVIRHEVVHIFNLDQTHFLVPHWLTEGLAVGNEGFPRPPMWNQLLLERVPKDELLDLDTIDLGFIRPRDPLERAMAYCQAQLYVDYIREKYGPKAPGELLAAYGDGLSTEAVIKRVCKVDKAELEKGYRTYLREVAAKIGGKPPTPRRTLTQLKADHEKKPEDLDTTAELAEAIVERDAVEARKLAQEVIDKKPNHPRASCVLARLEHKAGNVKKETELLEAALDRDNPDRKVLLALGEMYYDAGDFAKAAEIGELGRKAEPYEVEWLLRLAKIYAQTGDKDKQIAVLKDLVPTDADDLDHRKRLARLLQEAGKYDEAEKYARQALEIDVRDAEAREGLFRALRAQKKEDEAQRLEKILEK